MSQASEEQKLDLGGEGLVLARRLPAPIFWAIALVALYWILQWTCGVLLRMPQLEPDDFRFVARALDLSPAEGLGAGLVENRWDMLPFVDVDGGVRFWRPTFPGSFGVDARASDAFASTVRNIENPHARFEPILLTNIVLHALCCVLAILLAIRVAGHSVAALLGGLAFACFAPHAEAIWYGSGRNATLLTAAFTSTWLVHTWPKARSSAAGIAHWLRLVGAPLLLAAALFSKESAIVLLPLLCFESFWRQRSTSPNARWRERLVQTFAQDKWLWAAYGAVLLLWFGLRTVALAGFDAGQLVAPYVYPPWTAAFWPHALTSIGGSLDAIGLATPLAPFLRPEEFGERNSMIGVAIGTILVAALVAFTWRSRHGVVLLAFGLLSWLPTLPVYVSERYLYLPSVALFALAGLAIARLECRTDRLRPIAYALGALLIGGSVMHGKMLLKKHEYLGTVPRASTAVTQALAPVLAKGMIPKGSKILAVDFPGDVIFAQFFEDQLRVHKNDADLDLRVLSLLPDSANQKLPTQRLVIERRANNLELRGRGRNVLEQKAERRLFPMIEMRKGVKRATRDGSIALEVLDGDGTACTRVRYDLGEGWERAIILRYEPPTAHEFYKGKPAGLRIRQGRFVVE